MNRTTAIIAGAGVIASFLVNFIIAGPILGVIAGFVLSYFVQTRTQRRSWRRQFLLKNIDLIYGPLYNESISLENQYCQMLNSRHYYNFNTSIWEQIRNSYTYHMIEDENLRKEIDNFYLLIKSFNDIRQYSQQKVDEIVRKHGSKFYDLDVEKIIVFQDGDSYPSSVIVSDCLVSNIPPKQVFEDQNANLMIRIGYKEKNTYYNLEKKEAKDIEEFGSLWEVMFDESSKDETIQQVKILALKIHTENLRLRAKLVDRINLRHRL